MKLLVVCEGAVDRVILNKIWKHGNLPGEIDVSPHDNEKERREGGLGFVARMLGLWATTHKRALVVCDLDDLEPKDRVDELLHEAKTQTKQAISFASPQFQNDRVARVGAKSENGDCQIEIVLVTTRGATAPSSLQFKKTTMDDYALSMLLDPTVFAAFAAGQKSSDRLLIDDHARMLAKLDELSVLMMKNHAPIEDAKRCIALLTSAIGFVNSPAVLVERLISRATVEAMACLKPLLDDCRAAMAP